MYYQSHNPGPHWRIHKQKRNQKIMSSNKTDRHKKHLLTKQNIICSDDLYINIYIQNNCNEIQVELSKQNETSGFLLWTVCQSHTHTIQTGVNSLYGPLWRNNTSQCAPQLGGLAQVFDTRGEVPPTDYCAFHLSQTIQNTHAKKDTHTHTHFNTHSYTSNAATRGWRQKKNKNSNRRLCLCTTGN